MGPEMFFRPEVVSPDWTKPLDQELDEAILLCPVNTRRNLYKVRNSSPPLFIHTLASKSDSNDQNIILSGGSTQTVGLENRLDKTLKGRVLKRQLENEKKSKQGGLKPKPIEVNVTSSLYENFAVWNGGSMMAMSVILPS